MERALSKGESYFALRDERQRSLVHPFIWSLTAAFWVAYWRYDLPLPFFDDIAFAGTAVRLATGHGFGNPWLRDWMDANPFFIYPPAYFYIVAGWLKLFGVSAFALQTLYALLGVVITLSFGAVFRSITSAGGWVYFALSFVVLSAISYDGFRPDTVGLAVLGLGLYVGTRFQREVAVFLATLLHLVAIMTAPSLATYSVGLGFWTFWTRFLRPADGRQRLRACLPVVLAVALSVLAFFLMIDFRLKDFLEAFGINSEARRVFWPPGNLLALHPVVGLLAVLANTAFVFTRRGNIKAQELYLVVSGCLLASFFVHVHDIAFNFFLFSGVLVLWMAIAGHRYDAAFAVAYIAALIAFNGPLLEFMALRHPADPREYDRAKQIAAHAASEGRTVIFDAVALRYVFNENPPPQYVDLIYSRKIDPRVRDPKLNYFPHSTNTVWIAGCYTLALKSDARIVGVKSASLPILTRVLNPKRWQFPSEAWQIATVRFDRGESYRSACVRSDHATVRAQ